MCDFDGCSKSLKVYLFAIKKTSKYAVVARLQLLMAF